MDGLIALTALAAQVAAPPSAPPASAAPPAATGIAPARIGTGNTTYVDLQAGAGYSTNPFLELNGTGAAFGRFSVHAVHTRVSDRTTTVLSAFGQEAIYSRRFGSEQAFDLGARHDARVSEKLQLFGDADFAYDKGGQLSTQIIGVPNLPLPPGAIQPPGLLPSNGDFLSVTGRQYRFSAHFGGQLALSTRDYVNFSSGIEHSVFKGAFDTRYTSIPLSIGYNRQISTRTTVGARVFAETTDYQGPAKLRVITPQVTIQTALSQRMVFTGDIGVSFSSIDNGITTRHSTGLAADASLCSSGERDQFCARAAINQSTATAAGPARNYSVGVDYSRRLDADQTIQFSLEANRYSTPTSFIAGQVFSNASYVRAAADYTRKLGGRWFAGVDVAARKIAQNGPDPRADVGGSVFVRYRLGDLR